MNKRILAAALAGVVAIGALSGCGKDKSVKSNSADMPKGEVSYPIKTDVTLDYWVRLPSTLGNSVTNFADTEFAKQYYKDTGIKVKYIHPAQGQEKEVLNLLLASGEYPDIIETDWLSRNPDNMIDNGTIIKLNDLINDYSPNLKKYLEENPEIDKQIRTDSGNYFAYPFIRSDDRLLSTSGFMLRGDWLKELGLSSPETIDEWENVIRQFKEKKGASMPLACSLGGLYQLCGGFNTKNDFYIRDGKVVYGPAEENFKKFVECMRSWYEKGLIDVNFTVLDDSLAKANMLNGKSGIVFGAGGSTMGTLLAAKPTSVPGYTLSAAKFPTHEKGKTAEFGNKTLIFSSVNNAAITSQCKYPELAARFLDYSYSEKGYMLNNFGIEGVSYKMVDGYPKYTDVVTNNDKGLAMSQALPIYARASTEGPFVQDVRYIEQYYQHPEQKAALEAWSDNNDLDHKIPQITLTTDESREYSSIMNEIKTYRDEMISKFIVGDESIDKYGEYVEMLSKMKLDRALQIMQDAYKRFVSR